MKIILQVSPFIPKNAFAFFDKYFGQSRGQKFEAVASSIPCLFYVFNQRFDVEPSLS